MIFEQVFYGRGTRGYAVLGDSGCPFDQVSHAEMLCQLHGTPDAESASRLRPFLFQHCSCGRVYMGCGMAGRKDELGRNTLFFHVLVGDAEAVKRTGICAADLFRHGLFAKGQEDRKLERTDVDVQSWRIATRAPECRLALPAVVKCRYEASHRVPELLGGMVNQVGWTSCSWKVSGTFEAIGMPLSCSPDAVPPDFHVYDEDGRLLRGRTRSEAEAKAAGAVIGKGDGTAVPGPKNEEAPPSAGGDGSGNGGLVMLIAGFAAGILVGVLAAGRFSGSGPRISGFDERSRIADFDEELRAAGLYDVLTNGSDASRLLKKFRANVDFVNEYHPSGK